MAPSSVRSLNVVDASSSLGPSLSNVSAIGELINIVPHSWRSSIGNYLTTVYRVATKLCNVQNTIAQYDKHHAEGSFPASIKNAVKDPKIQFSKEFLGSEIGSLANNHLQSVIHSARKNLLEEAQKRKKEELATLQGLTHFHEINWKKLVLEVAERVGTTFNANPVVDQSGTQLSWKGTVPDDIKQDCKFLWTKGSTLHFKAVSLARAIADRSLVEKIKILNLKKDTDTAMRDADVESSTRDVVRDEMQTQLRLLKKELLQSMGKAKKPASQNNNKKKGGTNPSRVKKGPAKSKGKKNAKNR